MNSTSSYGHAMSLFGVQQSLSVTTGTLWQNTPPSRKGRPPPDQACPAPGSYLGLISATNGKHGETDLIYLNAPCSAKNRPASCHS